jgi:hypothetical protein
VKQSAWRNEARRRREQQSLTFFYIIAMGRSLPASRKWVRLSRFAALLENTVPVGPERKVKHKNDLASYSNFNVTTK